tara:strand:+ start:69 stop:407 length:339 start_codon:yes stop_codon:yes gene_type:complete
MSVYKICDILYQVVSMKFFFSILLVFLLFGCQTIEKKTDKIGQKEIKEMSKFLQQPESELKIEMGEPDEITHNEKGSKFFIYKKKKYGITCEKKFEIDENNMIVGVSSRGCF